MITNGNSLEVLTRFADNSFDSCVCDPPYELGFMGKSWDSTGIAYNVQLWREVLRVLKPGGHLLAFGGSRTFHRLACAIEDAGFEIRDQLLWIYGSGFPKSLDISKAIDKQAGAERDVIGHSVYEGRRPNNFGGNKNGGNTYGDYNAQPQMPITAPATPAAIKWQGWGTALKPAHEPICMARKPFKGTVADNVLQHGTGGLNVDAGRIGSEGGTRAINSEIKENGNVKRWDMSQQGKRNSIESIPSGRFPSNLLLSETAAQDLDESTGQNFSRFFYVAKASKREREAGLEGFEPVSGRELSGGGGVKHPKADAYQARKEGMRKNIHATVKPIKLMEYLVKLVTPPDGIILDPFAGSGSTGCACARLGFEFQGIELSPEYAKIAEARIQWFSMNEIDLDELDRTEAAKDIQGRLF